MIIDWAKLSELSFAAALQGLIGTVIVLITYRLGKMESDRAWKRELQQRQEDRQGEKIARHIDALQKVIDLYAVFKLRVSSGTTFTQEELANIQPNLMKARAILERLDNANLRYCLKGVGYLSITQSEPESRNTEKRLAIFNKVFDGLREELNTMESNLASTLESVGSWQ